MFKLNSKKITLSPILVSLVMLSSNVYADGAFESFRENINNTGKGVGDIVSVIAYTLAGILFLIAGWNMYKKSKNPNGNEGAMIMGSILAGSVLLAIPTVASIGEDGLFGSNEASTNIQFDSSLKAGGGSSGDKK